MLGLETEAALTGTLALRLKRGSVKSTETEDMDKRVAEGIDFVEKHFALYDVEHVDSRSMSIAVLIAGSGRGKTHFMEVLRLAALRKRWTPVFSTFNANMDIQLTRQTMRAMPLPLDWKLNYELAIRFLFSYYSSTLSLNEMAAKAPEVHQALGNTDALLRTMVDTIGADAKDSAGVARLLLGTDETLRLATLYGLKEAGEVEEAFSPLRQLLNHQYMAKMRVALVQSALWPGLVDRTFSERMVTCFVVPKWLPAPDVLCWWFKSVQDKFPDDLILVNKIFTVFRNWPRALEVAGDLMLQQSFAFISQERMEQLQREEQQGGQHRNTIENEKRETAVQLCHEVATVIWEKYLRMNTNHFSDDVLFQVLFHVVVPQLRGSLGQCSATVNVSEKIGNVDVRELIETSVYIPTDRLVATSNFVPTTSPALFLPHQQLAADSPTFAVFRELLAHPAQQTKHRGTLLETVCVRWLWFIGRCALARGRHITLSNLFLDVIGIELNVLLQGFCVNVNQEERVSVRQLRGLLPSPRHLQALGGEPMDAADLSDQVMQLKHLRADFPAQAATFKGKLETSANRARADFAEAIKFAVEGHMVILTEGRPIRYRGAASAEYKQAGFDAAIIGSVGKDPAIVFLEPHPMGGAVEGVAQAVRQKLKRLEELLSAWLSRPDRLRVGLMILTDADLRQKEVNEKLCEELIDELGPGQKISLGVADSRTLSAFLGPWDALYRVAVKERQVQAHH